MTEQEKNKGGRPPIPDEQKAKLRSIRLTDEHWAKLQRLGMDWLRKQIQRAKEPAQLDNTEFAGQDKP